MMEEIGRERLGELDGDGLTWDERCDRWREDGSLSVAFVTVTVGERDQYGDWHKVHDGAEASRRFNNLSRRVLPELFERFICVSERHGDGGIHYHLLAVLNGRPDIRTGYDFAAVEDGDYSSACPELREVWRVLRSDRVAEMGVGRCETEPVKVSGEAVARYVSEYIEKNLFHRLKSDRGQRLVRYHGFGGKHIKANDFSWCTPAAVHWRNQVRVIASLGGIVKRADARERIGPRWAYWLGGIAANVCVIEGGQSEWRDATSEHTARHGVEGLMRARAAGMLRTRTERQRDAAAERDRWERPMSDDECERLVEAGMAWEAEREARQAELVEAGRVAMYWREPDLFSTMETHARGVNQSAH